MGGDAYKQKLECPTAGGPAWGRQPHRIIAQEHNVNLLQTEPVRVTEFVIALIALLVAFGAPIQPEQRDAIIGFVVALIPFFEFIRSKVFAPATVERLEAEAAAAALGVVNR